MVVNYRDLYIFFLLCKLKSPASQTSGEITHAVAVLSMDFLYVLAQQF